MCPTPLHPGVGQPCPGGTGESLGPDRVNNRATLFMNIGGREFFKHCVKVQTCSTLYARMCRRVCYYWGVVEDDPSSDTSLLDAGLHYQHPANSHTHHSRHQNESVPKHRVSKDIPTVQNYKILHLNR